jgi:hypothetical protein
VSGILQKAELNLHKAQVKVGVVSEILVSDILKEVEFKFV